MSTTRSYPIINTIISDIAAAKTAQHDYIDDVLNIINGVTTTYVTYDVFGIYAPKLPDSMTDKVVYAYLHFNEPNPKTGFLFFRGNKKYWFVSFDGTCSKCFPYELEPGKVNGYDNQCLSMLEIREVIKNSAIVDVEWVNRMKPYLDYSAEDGVYVTDAKFTAGGQVEVDGTATFNGNVHVTHISGTDGYFLESNQLKVNKIKCLDAGETPTITFENCDVVFDKSVGTDLITSETAVGGSTVDFAGMDDDNQWHLKGLTVADSSFKVTANVIVPGIENIKKEVSGSTVPLFWHGTQAQYDALGTYNSDTVYIIVG